MKKKTRLWIAAGVLLLIILFAPIPGSPCKDGGTRAYSALTYKIVKWQRDTGYDVYKATKVYWLPNNFKSIDELWAGEKAHAPHHFTATVLEMEGGHALVQPVEGEMEASVGSAISVDTAALEDIGAQVGSDVEIYYTGNIRETSPAQLQPTRWEMATDLRHRAYTGSWLDPEAAQPVDDMADPVIISRIYSDCFFAYPVVPMPYEIKFNGELPPE